MYLRLVDKLIKQGDYVAALDAVAKARRHDPQNRYAIAIEARVRTLIDESEKAKRTGRPMPAERPKQELRSPIPPPEGLPSVEGQLNAIATPRPPPVAYHEGRTESKNLAILSKIASLLGTANEYLEKHEYERALDVVSRAALLDPTNADIRTIEQRIRAAREEARKREEEAQARRAAAERLRHEHLMQEELARVQHEQEERRRTEEAERKRAQQQRAMQVIRRAREFVAGGQIQEAQCELAYLSVLDPENPEVIGLEREISHRREEQHRAELEAYRRQMEEQRRREQAVREEIANTVREADLLASREKFSEALRTVTRGYILDPTNSDLQACENRIATAQSAWSERVQRERQEQQEALRKKLEEEEQRRQAEERERLVRAEEERQEEQKREKQQQIVRHLRKAHEHLAANRFKEAREEVASAFVLDPFSEDVAMLERRIADEQTRAAQSRVEPVLPPPSPEVGRAKPEKEIEAEPGTGAGAEGPQAAGPGAPDAQATGTGIEGPHVTGAGETAETVEAVEAVIARTLADAKRYAAEGRFEQALQETALAVALDPANDMIRRFESGIRHDWDEKRRIAREERKAESQKNESQKSESRDRDSQDGASQKAESQKSGASTGGSQGATSQAGASQTSRSQTDDSQSRQDQRAGSLGHEPPRQETRGPETHEPEKRNSASPNPAGAGETASGTEGATVTGSKRFAGWRRRAILAAAIVSALLLFIFYELTPPVPGLRPPGPGSATQSAGSPTPHPAENRLP